MKAAAYVIIGALVPVFVGLYVWWSTALACSLVDGPDAQFFLSVAFIIFPPIGGFVGYVYYDDHR